MTLRKMKKTHQNQIQFVISKMVQKNINRIFKIYWSIFIKRTQHFKYKTGEILLFIKIYQKIFILAKSLELEHLV